MISNSKIYTLNKTGGLIKAYGSLKHFIDSTGYSKEYVYEAIKHKKLVDKSFYISKTVDIETHLLARKSKIKTVLDLENYVILQKYRDNLILSSETDPQMIHDPKRIKREIIALTKVLT